MVALIATTELFDCKFHQVTKEQTVHLIDKLIKSDGKGYLSTVNVSILMSLDSDNTLKKYVSDAFLNVADGQPIILASRYINNPLPERVTGVDLVMDLAELSAKEKHNVFLLGATDSVVCDAEKAILRAVPNSSISGYHSGYFDIDNCQDLLNTINLSDAKILIVAMGVPRQEIFIDRYFHEINANFAIGVGGSFDVISGSIKRAPKWMQKCSLEWLYRTMQEPKRLFWRYFTTNTKFIYLFIKELIFKIKPGERK